MSRNIRLFPTYSQKENQTTNHCLLILKMLYEENSKFLSEALSSLLGENFSGSIGVRFVQQKRGKQSVPDGEIFQDPFSILIETKLGCNFEEKQLLDHLATLKDRQGQRLLLALGNFDGDPLKNNVIAKVEAQARSYCIPFAAVSFEQLLESIQLPYLPKNLADAISDLGEYLDENNLLPSWHNRLDIVNCRASFESVLQHKIYTCPVQDGQYNHRRSLYFGTYRNKCVEQIARIEAVINLTSRNEQTLLWKNNSQSDEDLIYIARERYQQTGEDFYPKRVFVLGELYSTDFKKVSSGGMQVSKQYFDINKLKIIDPKDLAEKLKGKTWENYESNQIDLN
jgi:hypothetical protein